MEENISGPEDADYLGGEWSKRSLNWLCMFFLKKEIFRHIRQNVKKCLNGVMAFICLNRSKTHIYIHSLPNPTELLINVFLSPVSKWRKMEKEATEIFEARKQMEFFISKNRERGILTVEKQKNNSTFSAGP